MKTPTYVQAGGFYLEDGLPDEYYAFSGGEISMTVERNGGINNIKVLDILQHEGKLYPDRCPTPSIIRKEGNKCGKRTLYGPGMQFISTNKQENGRVGRNLFHVPDKMELYPFGFLSESERFGHRTRYDLCIYGHAVLFRFGNSFPTRRKLLMTLNKEHLVSGQSQSMKHQMGASIFPDDDKMTLTWNYIGEDGESGVFVMDGKMQFAYGEKKTVVTIAATRPLEIQECKTRYVISCPWNTDGGSDEICMAIAIGENLAESLKLALDGSHNFDKICEVRIRENVAYALKAPSLQIEKSPHAAEFARVIPAFEKSLLLADTEKEVCIRAAAHKYGFFALWDQIYPAKAFLLMGDYETARKLLRYVLTIKSDYSDKQAHKMLWQILQLIISVEEVVAFSGDRSFLKETYGTLKEYFDALIKKADSATGLIACDNGCGVDDPGELGADGDVWYPCMNGWWHADCRAMENMAMIMNDWKTAESAGIWGLKLERSFMEVFYDEKKGYLRSVVDPKTRRNAGVYQNVCTIAMDYPYGEYLFRTHLKEIAEYQAYALYHPAGRSSVSYDDNADEMWKNVIMFQHLAHETKTARAAGLGDEALRITNNYLRIFNRCKVGIETHNIVGSEGDISQRANWQAFGARACYGALIEGVVGVQWDMGGFHYVPCDIPGNKTLLEFPFRQTRWNMELKGEGAFVSQMLVDGLPLQGSLRIPFEYLTGSAFHRLEIFRSDKPFTRPTLLSLVGGSLCGLNSSEKELSFGVTERARIILKAFCPVKPVVQLNGKDIPVEWNPKDNIIWGDLLMEPGQKLSISI